MPDNSTRAHLHPLRAVRCDSVDHLRSGAHSRSGIRLARSMFQGAQIMKTYIKLSCLTALVVAALILGIGIPAYAEDPPPFPPNPIPIPPQAYARPVPAFSGKPATPHLITAP